MARNNTIKLFDLQLASGCTISPFVWSTKYALKHKGFDIEIVRAASRASSNAPADAQSACR